LIDRLLLELHSRHFPAGAFEALQALFNRLIEINPDGAVSWEKPRTSKLRSDDPDVNLCFTGTGVRIWGSPAMAMQQNNVFGSSDIIVCAQALIRKASKNLNFIFPAYDKWDLKGIDITHNYLLDSPQDVKTALNYLGRISDGRLKTVRYPSTVYFGYGSQLRTGKVYAKGNQLERLERKLDLGISVLDRALTYRLLRFELCLKGGWFRRYKKVNPDFVWYDWKSEDLDMIYDDFWTHLLGDGTEIPRSDYEQEGCIIDAALSLGMSQGYGLAAYKTWCCIQSLGVEQARSITSNRTWYRHIKILRQAGFTSADFDLGKVEPIRLTYIRLSQPVESWAELRRLA